MTIGILLILSSGCRVPESPGLSSPSVPFVATPPDVVIEMLKLPGITSNDLVYDLGSGDGRLAIAAATLFGARAVGVEIDAKLVQESREAAARAGVADRVTFIWGDLFKTDLRPATAVMLYLLPEINLRLRPKLLAELRPGTAVVSHNFDMGEWIPDRSVRVFVSGGSQRVALWIIPARVQGTWSLKVTFADGEATATGVLEQNFQRFGGIMSTATSTSPIVETMLNGEIIAFSTTIAMKPGSRSIRFRGRVSGDTMEGTAEVTGGLAIDPGRWVATKMGDRSHGGPRNGPPYPPALGPPWDTHGAPRSHVSFRGPRNGPPYPPALGPPWDTQGAPRSHASFRGPRNGPPIPPALGPPWDTQGGPRSHASFPGRISAIKRLHWRLIFQPSPPLIGSVSNGELVAATDQGGAQQTRLRRGAVKQPLGGIAGHVEPQSSEAGTLAVDEG